MSNIPKDRDRERDQDPQRFESDSQKLVRRHLEDKNHVITEQEMRQVQVGQTPVPQPVDAKKHVEEVADKIERESGTKEEDVKPRDEPITPWDTIRD